MKTRTIIGIISVIAIILTLSSCSPSCSESGRRQLEREKVYFSLENVGNIDLWNDRFLVLARHYDITVTNDSMTKPEGHFFMLIITKREMEKYDNWEKLNERMATEYEQAKNIGKPAIYCLNPRDIKKSVPLADRYEATIRWQDVHLYRTPVPANNPDSLFNPAKPNRRK
jgi:hypothetical protein